MNRVGDAVACGFEEYLVDGVPSRYRDAQELANDLIGWYTKTIGPFRLVWLEADECLLAGKILGGMIDADARSKGVQFRTTVPSPYAPLPWTAEEDQFIRDHPTLSDRELSDATGHPVGSTKVRRRMLLGSRDRPTMVRLADDNAYMTAHWKALDGGKA